MTKHLKQVQAISEEDLLYSLRNGDDKALKTIYRQHYHTIINMVTNNAGSLQEAKDIYQETLIVFYEKVKEYFYWVFGVAAVVAAIFAILALLK